MRHYGQREVEAIWMNTKWALVATDMEKKAAQEDKEARYDAGRESVAVGIAVVAVLIASEGAVENKNGRVARRNLSTMIAAANTVSRRLGTL